MEPLVAAAVWLLAVAGLGAAAPASPQPNIVFILADDLGWNDVSFHGSDQIPTPNIDALAYHGVILNSHYVQPVCTPSRAALMTGKYPIRTGMQAHVIAATDLSGLPEGKILPQYLRELGYVTRAVGKWHLGHHAKNYTPTYRGFDSHFGYWNGMVGYYDFIVQSGNMSGYDLRDDMKTAWEHSGRYVTDVFTEEAERLIGQHDTSRPLFLYFSHLACHAGDEAKLLDAPQEVVNKFNYISDPNRRLLAAVVSKMDESVGRVVSALENRGMLNNSIIVFASDNGAPTSGFLPNWGSNYPLRGGIRLFVVCPNCTLLPGLKQNDRVVTLDVDIKGTLWEGGVRGVAAVWSPLLHSAPRVSHQLMHITDWLPTLYAAAGGNSSPLADDLDGVNVWPQLVAGRPHPRADLLLNVDEEAASAAVRVANWKLITGTQKSDEYEGASGREDGQWTPAYDAQQVLDSPAAQALRRTLGGSTPAEDIPRLRAEATVSCPERPQQPRCSDLCVFDLLEDPCEAGGGSAPEGVLAMLLERLDALSRPLQPQQVGRTQPRLADPRRWNNTWVPWTDCLRDPADEACNVV